MAQVLIMEDEPGIAMILEMVLSDDGHQVTSVPNGQSGLDLLAKGKIPDVALVDLHMPVVDGRAVVEKMHSTPALQRVPIVIMTGAAGDAEALPPRSHFATVLSKPFDIWDAVNQVRKLTSTARAVS